MSNETDEIQRSMEEMRRQATSGAEAIKKLAEQAKEAEKQLAQWKKGWADAKGASASFAKSAIDGADDLKSFNTAIDAAAGVASALASILPGVGLGLGKTITALTVASKALITHLDFQTKQFKEVADVGGLLAGGMEDLQTQFVASGQTFENYKKTIVANSVVFARFKGIVGEGAQNFSIFSGELAKYDSVIGAPLRLLGMGVEELTAGAAGYLSMQTRLGLAQGKSNEQLTRGTYDYIKELDVLKKVTGLSSKAIIAQQDAALSKARFRATYDLMIANGQEKAAKGMMDFQTYLSSFGDGSIATAVQDLFSGVAVTPESLKILASTNGKAFEIVQQFKNEMITMDQATDQLRDAFAANAKTISLHNQAAQTSNELGIDQATASDFQAKKQRNNFELASKTQNAQMTGANALTKSVTDAAKNIEEVNRLISEEMIKLMPATGAALKALTGQLRDAFKYIHDLINSEKKRNEAMFKVLDMIADLAGELTPGGIGGPVVKMLGELFLGMNGITKKGSSGPAQKGGSSGAEGAAPSSGSSGAGAAAPSATDLTGLPIKGAESTAGGAATEETIALARLVYDKYGKDIKYFSAFNDLAHKGGKHASGQAFDFTLNDPSKYAEIASAIRGMPGAAFAQYEHPGNKTKGYTGPHIHVASAATGGVLSGPKSGYAATLHGTEAVVPLPNGRSIPIESNNGATIEIMTEQLEALQELVSTMKSQLGVSNKILQYSQ